MQPVTGQMPSELCRISLQTVTATGREIPEEIRHEHDRKPRGHTEKWHQKFCENRTGAVDLHDLRRYHQCASRALRDLREGAGVIRDEILKFSLLHGQCRGSGCLRILSTVRGCFSRIGGKNAPKFETLVSLFKVATLLGTIAVTVSAIPSDEISMVLMNVSLKEFRITRPETIIQHG